MNTEKKKSLVQKLNKERKIATQAKVACEATVMTAALTTLFCTGMCASADYSWSQIFSNMGHVLLAGIAVSAVAGCIWLIADRVIIRTEVEYEEYIRICREFFGRR